MIWKEDDRRELTMMMQRWMPAIILITWALFTAVLLGISIPVGGK